MKRTLILALLILVSNLTAWAQKNDSPLNEIVAAEKAFAAMAKAQGTRAAFLEFAAPDGMVFNTKPENAQEFWGKRSANKSLLAWSPVWADVSSEGNLGFTTGNWEFCPTGEQTAPVAWGEYLTIWKKQTDGKWKFEIDIGLNHDSAPLATDWKSPTPIKKNALEKSETWQNLEINFNETMRSQRAAGAYQKLGSDNLYLLREGKLLIIGKKAALGEIPREKLTLKTKALGGEASGDFVYSYGEYAQAQNGKTENGYFVRVWKRESKGWRIALDLMHPIPPQS